jgi:hypothetical protein
MMGGGRKDQPSRYVERQRVDQDRAILLVSSQSAYGVPIPAARSGRNGDKYNAASNQVVKSGPFPPALNASKHSFHSFSISFHFSPAFSVIFGSCSASCQYQGPSPYPRCIVAVSKRSHSIGRDSVIVLLLLHLPILPTRQDS